MANNNNGLAIPGWAAILFLVPLLVLFVWQLNVAAFPPPPPPARMRAKRIVLLIAHPDDESMFFSPTVLGLTDPALGNHVKILCLSTGDADGLGETRKKELEAAAVTLGIRSREDVLVLDDQTRFKDGMKEQWAAKDIADVLAKAFAQDNQSTSNKKSKKSSSSGPSAKIDTLITFDQHGVSSHPNHIALFHGAKQFLSDLMRGHAGYAPPVSLYTLTTVGLLRKYTFTLDLLPTYFTGIAADFWAVASGKKKPSARKGASASGTKGHRAVFLNDLSKYVKARNAMIAGHKSQMVWFRHGWISIGRYMVINDLKLQER